MPTTPTGWPSRATVTERRPRPTIRSSAACSVEETSTTSRERAAAGSPERSRESTRSKFSRLRAGALADEAGDEVVGRARRRIASGVSYWAMWEPSRSTAIRSPSLTASSKSWVTKTMVLRSVCCSRRNSSCSRSRVIGSTAPNGSSISMTGGSAASARATPTRCCWPPESWRG